MNYSANEYMCRVDFFKPSGQWYCTEAVSFQGGLYDEALIHDAFDKALKRHLQGRLSGMTAVCLDPYHANSHPLMVVVP